MALLMLVFKDEAFSSNSERDTVSVSNQSDKMHRPRLLLVSFRLFVFFVFVPLL